MFVRAEAGHVELLIPTMVLAEIGYLSEKGRIDTSLETGVSYVEECNTIAMEPITAQIVVPRGIEEKGRMTVSFLKRKLRDGAEEQR